jgi:hypothetical protein
MTVATLVGAAPVGKRVFARVTHPENRAGAPLIGWRGDVCRGTVDTPSACCKQTGGATLDPVIGERRRAGFTTRRRVGARGIA